MSDRSRGSQRLRVGVVIAVAVAAVPLESKGEAATLRAVPLGALAGSEGSSIAVSWQGKGRVRILVFEDLDGNSRLDSGERLLVERSLGRGIEVVALPNHDLQGPVVVDWEGEDGRSGTIPILLAGEPPCGWQPDFSLPDLDGAAHSTLVWDDGGGVDLYVAGEFRRAGGVQVDHIARWNGSEWSSLPGLSGAGTNGPIYALAVFDDGGGPELYATGDFTMAGGVSAARLAKWDGASWTALASPAGPDDTGLALAVWDDGTGPALYVGGEFTSIGATQVNRIARWDGTSWATLPGMATVGVGGSVRALAAWDDGGGSALFVGGDFATAGGLASSRIARWRGVAWTALAGSGGNGITNATPSHRVEAITAWDDGNGPALFVGGRFAEAGGVPASSLARWNGADWSSVPGGSINGVAGGLGAVRSLAVWNDSTGEALYVGGYFTSAAGIAANRVARWDGSGWAALGSGVEGGEVFAFAPWDDGMGERLVAAGSFSLAEHAVAHSIAAWDGTAWARLPSELGHGVDGTILAAVQWNDGSGPALYVGGQFSAVGGVVAHNVAKWNGRVWSPLAGPAGEGTAGTGFTPTVFALATWNDGGGSALYAGGSFDAAGGVVTSQIAKWNGTGWSALEGPLGEGMDASVRVLTAWDDGGGSALYAGGQFTTAGGVLTNRIAKWDGTEWTALASPGSVGMNAAVWALAGWDDGPQPGLYAGGNFTMAGVTTAGRVARWNGSGWAALTGAMGEGVGVDGNTVTSLLVWDDASGAGERLFVGGLFNGAGGLPINKIATWNGIDWAAVSVGGGANDDVNALALYDDGAAEALFVAGDFTTVHGVSASRVARWDGSVWSALDGPMGDGTNGPVKTLAPWAKGSERALFAGGVFETAGGIPSVSFAKYACPAESIFADDFESGATGQWSTTFP